MSDARPSARPAFGPVWILVWAWLAAVAGLMAPSAATAAALTPQAGWTQKLGGRLPLDAVFVDESGMRRSISELTDGRPFILTFAYAGCPMLCPLVLGGLADALSRIDPGLARSVRVLTVSLDPTETPASARAQKRGIRVRLGSSPVSWTFLVDRSGDLARVASAAGFRYSRGPRSGQYAHPSGALVASSDGVIRQYFFGVQFDPTLIESAIRTAAVGRTGSFVQTLLLLCFHYDPSVTPIGARVLLVVRLTAALCAALVAAVIARTIFREREQRT